MKLFTFKIFCRTSTTCVINLSVRSIIADVLMWLSSSWTKLSFAFRKSITWIHVTWLDNQFCSVFFAMRTAIILLKNDASSGFRGGSRSRKAYSFDRSVSSPARRSFNDGMSQVIISQAILAYLNRKRSSISSGGSVVVRVTNSCKTSCFIKLKIIIL